MSDIGLTNEEKRSLKLWFRQAIAEVEMAEVSWQLIRRHGLETATTTGHRSQISRRRAPRSPQVEHRKELVAT